VQGQGRYGGQCDTRQQQQQQQQHEPSLTPKSLERQRVGPFRNFNQQLVLLKLYKMTTTTNILDNGLGNS
jgi:hypothetical protein